MAPGLRRKSGVSTSIVVLGRLGTDLADRLGEMPCPAILEVVAIDGGDDDMGEAEGRHRLADIGGLMRIEPVRAYPS